MIQYVICKEKQLLNERHSLAHRSVCEQLLLVDHILIYFLFVSFTSYTQDKLRGMPVKLLSSDNAILVPWCLIVVTQ